MPDIITCSVCGHDFHGWEGTCPHCEGQSLEEWREAAQAAENQLDEANEKIRELTGRLMAWKTYEDPTLREALAETEGKADVTRVHAEVGARGGYVLCDESGEPVRWDDDDTLMLVKMKLDESVR